MEFENTITNGFWGEYHNWTIWPRELITENGLDINHNVYTVALLLKLTSYGDQMNANVYYLR